MTPSNPTKPHVFRDRTIGGIRYVLRAWLDNPEDWMRVAEWEIERRDEVVAEGCAELAAHGAHGGTEEE